MVILLQKRRAGLSFKGVVFFLITAFILSGLAGYISRSSTTYASALPYMPAPTKLINTSAYFEPLTVKGIKLYAQDPFKFDFTIDEGNTDYTDQDLEKESKRLIKYFLAALTVPEDDIWVNLSPYEKDHIIPNELGLTDMGRDLLGEDYILKQLTSSLTYPEDPLGKEFWKKVYEKAYALYGTTNISIDTFNKVWIVPSKAVIYSDNDRAYVGEAKLKVMIEEDYVAQKQNTVGAGLPRPNNNINNHDISKLSSNVFKDVVLPTIEYEVNNGRQFSRLRQIYKILILAAWFKKRLRRSVDSSQFTVNSPVGARRAVPAVLDRIYFDKKKIVGIEGDDPQIKEKVYNQYLEAYRKGVYNYIRKDYDPYLRKNLRRKYYSGGFVGKTSNLIDDGDDHPFDELPPQERAGIDDNVLTFKLENVDSATKKETEPGPLKVPSRRQEKLPSGQFGKILAKSKQVDFNTKKLQEVFSRVDIGPDERANVSSDNVRLYFSRHLPPTMDAIGRRESNGVLVIIINQAYISPRRIDYLKLAEVIDHEWTEHIEEQPHYLAAQRQKEHFSKNQKKLTPYHKWAIGNMDRQQLKDIVDEYRKNKNIRGWGEYEDIFYKKSLRRLWLLRIIRPAIFATVTYVSLVAAAAITLGTGIPFIVALGLVAAAEGSFVTLPRAVRWLGRRISKKAIAPSDKVDEDSTDNIHEKAYQALGRVDSLVEKDGQTLPVIERIKKLDVVGSRTRGGVFHQGQAYPLTVAMHEEFVDSEPELFVGKYCLPLDSSKAKVGSEVMQVTGVSRKNYILDSTLQLSDGQQTLDVPFRHPLDRYIFIKDPDRGFAADNIDYEAEIIKTLSIKAYFEDQSIKSEASRMADYLESLYIAYFMVESAQEGFQYDDDTFLLTSDRREEFFNGANIKSTVQVGKDRRAQLKFDFVLQTKEGDKPLEVTSDNFFKVAFPQRGNYKFLNISALKESPSYSCEQEKIEFLMEFYRTQLEEDCSKQQLERVGKAIYELENVSLAATFKEIFFRGIGKGVWFKEDKEVFDLRFQGLNMVVIYKDATIDVIPIWDLVDLILSEFKMQIQVDKDLFREFIAKAYSYRLGGNINHTKARYQIWKSEEHIQSILPTVDLKIFFTALSEIKRSHDETFQRLSDTLTDQLGEPAEEFMRNLEDTREQSKRLAQELETKKGLYDRANRIYTETILDGGTTDGLGQRLLSLLNEVEDLTVQCQKTSNKLQRLERKYSKVKIDVSQLRGLVVLKEEEELGQLVSAASAASDFLIEYADQQEVEYLFGDDREIMDMHQEAVDLEDSLKYWEDDQEGAVKIQAQRQEVFDRQRKLIEARLEVYRNLEEQAESELDFNPENQKLLRRREFLKNYIENLERYQSSLDSVGPKGTGFDRFRKSKVGYSAMAIVAGSLAGSAVNLAGDLEEDSIDGDQEFSIFDSAVGQAKELYYLSGDAPRHILFWLPYLEASQLAEVIKSGGQALGVSAYEEVVEVYQPRGMALPDSDFEGGQIKEKGPLIATSRENVNFLREAVYSVVENGRLRQAELPFEDLPQGEKTGRTNTIAREVVGNTMILMADSNSTIDIDSIESSHKFTSSQDSYGTIILHFDGSSSETKRVSYRIDYRKPNKTFQAVEELIEHYLQFPEDDQPPDILKERLDRFRRLDFNTRLEGVIRIIADRFRYSLGIETGKMFGVPPARWLNHGFDDESFDQREKITAQCSVLAMYGMLLARYLGIPARIVTGVSDANGNKQLFSSEGHAIFEVMDPKGGGWIEVDLTSDVEQDDERLMGQQDSQENIKPPEQEVSRSPLEERMFELNEEIERLKKHSKTAVGKAKEEFLSQQKELEDSLRNLAKAAPLPDYSLVEQMLALHPGIGIEDFALAQAIEQVVASLDLSEGLGVLSDVITSYENNAQTIDYRVLNDIFNAASNLSQRYQEQISPGSTSIDPINLDTETHPAKIWMYISQKHSLQGHCLKLPKFSVEINSELFRPWRESELVVILRHVDETLTSIKKKDLPRYQAIVNYVNQQIDSPVNIVSLLVGDTSEEKWGSSGKYYDSLLPIFFDNDIILEWLNINDLSYGLFTKDYLNFLQTGNVSDDTMYTGGYQKRQEFFDKYVKGSLVNGFGSPTRADLASASVPDQQKVKDLYARLALMAAQKLGDQKVVKKEKSPQSAAAHKEKGKPDLEIIFNAIYNDSGRSVHAMVAGSVGLTDVAKIPETIAEIKKKGEITYETHDGQYFSELEGSYAINHYGFGIGEEYIVIEFSGEGLSEGYIYVTSVDPGQNEIQIPLDEVKKALGDISQSKITIKIFGTLKAKTSTTDAEVDRLIRGLKDPDPEVRADSADALGGVGSPAEEAVLALAEALKDEDKVVRSHSAWALGEIGPAAKPALAQLRKLAKDDSEEFVRTAAQEAIEKIEKGSAENAGVEDAEIDRLIKGLKDPDPEVRKDSARVLGKIGPAAKPAVSALIDVLKDPDSKVRVNSARALAAIGPAAKEAISALTKALKDGNKYVRWNSAWALGQIGPAAEPAVSSLIEALKDKDWVVRANSATALGEIGPAAEPALVRLRKLAKNDPDEEVRTAVQEAIGKIEKGSESVGTEDAEVDRLIKGLKDPDPKVRKDSARVLGKIGPAAKPAVSALIEALKDPDFKVRANSAGTLGDIGPAAKEAVSALIEALKDENKSVRRNSAGTLGDIGPAAKEAVSALIEALKDENKSVRSNSAGALGKIGPAAKEAVSALAEALKDEDENVRQNSAGALGDIGPAAKEAVSDLIGTLTDKNNDVSYNSAWALGEIGPAAKPTLTRLSDLSKQGFNEKLRTAAQEAIEKIEKGSAEDASVEEAEIDRLIRGLENVDYNVRSDSATALGRIGLAAKKAVPDLIERLADQKAKVRMVSSWALGQIGSVSDEVMLLLISTLEDSNHDTREGSAWALSYIGPAAEPALVQLRKLAKNDSKDFVRTAAQKAIEKIENSLEDVSIDQAMIDGLIETLNNPDPVVRAKSAKILGDIGPAAKKATSALIIALEDSDELVRANSARALGEFGIAAWAALPMLGKLKKNDDYEAVRYQAEVAIGKIDRAQDQEEPQESRMPNQQDIENLISSLVTQYMPFIDDERLRKEFFQKLEPIFLALEPGRLPTFVGQFLLSMDSVARDDAVGFIVKIIKKQASEFFSQNRALGMEAMGIFYRPFIDEDSLKEIKNELYILIAKTTSVFDFRDMNKPFDEKHYSNAFGVLVNIFDDEDIAQITDKTFWEVGEQTIEFMQDERKQIEALKVEELHSRQVADSGEAKKIDKLYQRYRKRHKEAMAVARQLRRTETYIDLTNIPRFISAARSVVTLIEATQSRKANEWIDEILAEGFLVLEELEASKEELSFYAVLLSTVLKIVEDPETTNKINTVTRGVFSRIPWQARLEVFAQVFRYGDDQTRNFALASLFSSLEDQTPEEIERQLRDSELLGLFTAFVIMHWGEYTELNPKLFLKLIPIAMDNLPRNWNDRDPLYADFAAGLKTLGVSELEANKSLVHYIFSTNRYKADIGEQLGRDINISLNLGKIFSLPLDLKISKDGALLNIAKSPGEEIFDLLVDVIAEYDRDITAFEEFASEVNLSQREKDVVLNEIKDMKGVREGARELFEPFVGRVIKAVLENDALPETNRYNRNLFELLRMIKTYVKVASPEEGQRLLEFYDRSLVENLIELLTKEQQDILRTLHDSGEIKLDEGYSLTDKGVSIDRNHLFSLYAAAEVSSKEKDFSVIAQSIYKNLLGHIAYTRKSKPGPLKRPSRRVIDVSEPKLSDGQFEELVDPRQELNFDKETLIEFLRSSPMDMEDADKFRNRQIRVYLSSQLPETMDACGRQEEDGSLSIIVNSNYINQDNFTFFALGEVIDHEWTEHIDEEEHDVAAQRQKRYFSENETQLTPYHAWVIERMSFEQLEALAEEYEDFHKDEWGKYEEMFYKIAQRKLSSFAPAITAGKKSVGAESNEVTTTPGGIDISAGMLNIDEVTVQNVGVQDAGGRKRRPYSGDFVVPFDIKTFQGFTFQIIRIERTPT
ncbi:MAG: hypothetical protein GY858_01555 [Candidatus Omnitrophica bacterium]|nr:hypothetical protein [Candidatus Omnitrophota bacterium]